MRRCGFRDWWIECWGWKFEEGVGDRVGVRVRVNDRVRARSWGACRLLVVGRRRDKDKGNERVGLTILLQRFGPAWLRFNMKHF